MKTKKKWAMRVVSRVASLVELHYASHGIKVKLQLHDILSNYQRLIFHVILMPGTKVDGIFERAADIQVALQLQLFQPFREGVSVFLAVSQKSVSENSLWKMLTSQAFLCSKATLPVALGYDLLGRMVFADLETMPHAMYAGATRSGKSIGLICLIMSLICKHPASEVNLVIFDIGASSLDALGSVPHLSCPIVKDRTEGIHVIQSLKEEMERRIVLSSPELSNLPAVICVVDEYASFISSVESEQRQKVAGNISNLLRRGRKAKIHMVLATQDPKNKTMEVEIDNITTRMAFKVARFQTSIAILNCAGAEKLPGNGAMLYRSEEYPEPLYIQGAYISDAEVGRLVERINGTEQAIKNMFLIPENTALYLQPESDVPPEAIPATSGEESEFAKIIIWTLEQDGISVEKIKRKFSMGNRANGIMDKLYETGLVSEKFANQPRRVLPRSVEDVPAAVMELLTREGISAEDVAAAFNRRNSSDLTVTERRNSDDTSC